MTNEVKSDEEIMRMEQGIREIPVRRKKQSARDIVKKLKNAISEKVAQGGTYDEITSYLNLKHGFKISPSTLRTYMNEIKREAQAKGK